MNMPEIYVGFIYIYIILVNIIISPDSLPLFPTPVVADSCLTIWLLPFLFYEMLPNIVA